MLQQDCSCGKAKALHMMVALSIVLVNSRKTRNRSRPHVREENFAMPSIHDSPKAKHTDLGRPWTANGFPTRRVVMLNRPRPQDRAKDSNCAGVKGEAPLATLVRHSAATATVVGVGKGPGRSPYRNAAGIRAHSSTDIARATARFRPCLVHPDTEHRHEKRPTSSIQYLPARAD
jgi:hypothetical protein